MLVLAAVGCGSSQKKTEAAPGRVCESQPTFLTALPGTKPDTASPEYWQQKGAALEAVVTWPRIQRIQPVYRAGYVGWSAGHVRGSSGGSARDPGHYELAAELEAQGAYVRLGAIVRLAGRFHVTAEYERSFVRLRTTSATVAFREQESALGETPFAPFGGNALLAGIAVAMGGSVSAPAR